MLEPNTRDLMTELSTGCGGKQEGPGEGGPVS